MDGSLRLPSPRPQLAPLRKRSYDDFHDTSSEPPLFSSDGPNPSAEDYKSPRRKRQYRLPWFEAETFITVTRKYAFHPKPRERGPFRRNFDSGVYMGSDDSEDVEYTYEVTSNAGKGSTTSNDENVPDLSSGGEEEDNIRRRALEVQDSQDPMNFEGPVFPYWQQQPADLKRYHAVQMVALKTVGVCVESGFETCDLSRCGLEQVRAPVLQPLRDYTKQDPNQNINDPDHYGSLTPALKLNLSGNSLDEIPGSLYQLHNLEVLTLRNNNLTEILPAIGSLTSMKDLNIGGNQLRFLPYELLTLMRFGALGRVNTFPNPFVQPYPALPQLANTPTTNEECFPPYSKHWASSPTAFLDTFGASIRGYPMAPSSTLEAGYLTSDQNVPPLSEQNKTPSMLETMLRALLYNEPTISQLPFLLSETGHSSEQPHLTDLLKRLFRLREAHGGGGGSDKGNRWQLCTVCETPFVIPRTEWIEWWSIEHGLIPFLRRGCSWQCWVDVERARKEEGLVICGWSSKGGAHYEELQA